MDVSRSPIGWPSTDLVDGYADAADRHDPVAFAALFLPTRH